MGLFDEDNVQRFKLVRIQLVPRPKNYETCPSIRTRIGVAMSDTNHNKLFRFANFPHPENVQKVAKRCHYWNRWDMTSQMNLKECLISTRSSSEFRMIQMVGFQKTYFWPKFNSLEKKLFCVIWGIRKIFKSVVSVLSAQFCQFLILRFQTSK